MPFVCPECESPGALAITACIELPPDSRSDEIALQVVECGRCGVRAVAVFEESRRGSLDSEAVGHSGYRLPGETLDSLIAQISSCPDPANRGCRCESHRDLGMTDDSGRWCGFGTAAHGFPMRYSRE